MIIAVDGPSASGKGTLGKELANRLELAHLDTGKLYRLTALRAVNKKIDLDHLTETTLLVVEELAKQVSCEIQEGQLDLLQDQELRREDVGVASSKVATVAKVRQALLDCQRNFAKKPPFGRGAVLDGRDIGTVVCPDADFKLFITASAEARADRRYKELQNLGKECNLSDVLADIVARDQRDSSRVDSPLRPAQDAFVIDTTDMDAQQALETAMDYVAMNTVQLKKAVAGR